MAFQHIDLSPCVQNCPWLRVSGPWLEVKEWSCWATSAMPLDSPAAMHGGRLSLPVIVTSPSLKFIGSAAAELSFWTQASWLASRMFPWRLSAGAASGPLVLLELSLIGAFSHRGRPPMVVDMIGDWVTQWSQLSQLAATWDCWWLSSALSAPSVLSTGMASWVPLEMSSWVPLGFPSSSWDVYRPDITVLVDWA